jgi:hypothetical protein
MGAGRRRVAHVDAGAISGPVSEIRPTRSTANGTAGVAPGEHSENQVSNWLAGKVVSGEAIMKSSLHQTATPQHRLRPHGNDQPHPKTPRRRFLGLAAGAAARPVVSPLRWGWRFLPVFAVVTNVIVAIAAWYAVGALLR